MCEVKALSIATLKQRGLKSFLVVDIRSSLAYKSAHLADSLHLDSPQAILDFYKTSRANHASHCFHNLSLTQDSLTPPPADYNQPLLIICFSSQKAKTLAHKLRDNQAFLSLYGHTSIYFLASGIMEAFDSGFEALQQPQLPTYLESTLYDLKTKFLQTQRTFIIAFSGGKDSTCVLQLVYEMLLSLEPNQRRQTYAIASNTLVEAPHISHFLRKVIDSINSHARANNIPFEVLEVSPSLKDDFWVNLIGKGYPSPTRTFRWCTDRLKITPAKQQVAQITQKHGSALLILGTRKAESNNRKKSIEKRVLNEQGYSQHHDFPDTLTYSPIVEWSTDEVWAYLSTHKPLWSKDHSELFSLYSKASGEECQFITDLSQKSCGGSRFGCWVCTVVSEDKSLQGFIASGEEHLKPLNEFRDYIKALREDSSARADYKRNGMAAYKVGRLGPFLSHKRKEILHKLLKAEEAFMQNGGEELISDEQILAIQEIWDREFDFNKSAISLAKEVGRMKEKERLKSKVLHKELLEQVSEDSGIESQLLEELISTSIDICNNTSLRGRNPASVQIKKHIEKLINDKTSKRGHDVY